MALAVTKVLSRFLMIDAAFDNSEVDVKAYRGEWMNFRGAIDVARGGWHGERRTGRGTIMG